MQGLFILVALVCSIVAIQRYRGVAARLSKLEREVARQSAWTATQRQSEPGPNTDLAASPVPEGPASSEWIEPSPLAPSMADSAHSSQAVARLPSALDRFTDHLTTHWMIWLGGFCVALAGIFLARYSIEMGLVGPKARVAMGFVTGFTLHGAAEYLRRRMQEAHPAFAALAGGGTITLFATLLASLHLYQQISPAAAFVMMAIIALGTLALAYLHGPVLAAIGIVGAYIVPVLVSSGEGRVLVALTYALVISASALLLLRYVFRTWLWWGFVAGMLGWWAITLHDGSADGFRGIYLTIAAYLMLAIPGFDWLLKKPVRFSKEVYQFKLFGELPLVEQLSAITFVLVIVAQAVSIGAEANYVDAFWLWTPLVVLAFVASGQREYMLAAPVLLLAAQGGAWLLLRLDQQAGHLEFILLGAPDDKPFLWYLAGTALIYTGFALWNLARCRFKAVSSALAALTPVLCLALGYLFTSRLLVSWQWASVTVLVGLAYMALATASLKKRTPESLVIWLFFGGHFALSLAAVMVLDEASLTLAIAAQVISTAWIIRAFDLPALGWVAKLLVGVVVMRLTLNPWLATYPQETHWSLWTYGGSTLFCAFGAWQLRPWPALARWAEGGALHLFVLTVFSEIRYWLSNGGVFSGGFNATEVATYVSAFGAIAIVYYRRSQVSETLAPLYRIFSNVLMVAAVGCYCLLLLAMLGSFEWLWGEIGPMPIFNLTALMFLAPVCLAAMASLFWFPARRSMALGFAAATAFIYITIQIRHVWQGTVRLDLHTLEPELYTYSIVWLVLAVGALLGGTWRLGQRCYRGGMALLVLVIGKLFLVDLAGLDGLYRVASFMGLGICLLALSYLHQRLTRVEVVAE